MILVDSWPEVQTMFRQVCCQVSDSIITIMMPESSWCGKKPA